MHWGHAVTSTNHGVALEIQVRTKGWGTVGYGDFLYGVLLISIKRELEQLMFQNTYKEVGYTRIFSMDEDC